jgi:hypothetical protein
MILVGDLGDINAIGRRDGFDAAMKGNEAVVEVVARIPTEWSQEKAQAGVVNAARTAALQPNLRIREFIVFPKTSATGRGMRAIGPGCRRVA